MVYTVTLNPALDYYMRVNELKEDVQTADKISIVFGGKGINVSYVLQQLDVESVALGFVGGFSGEKLVSLLEKESIKTNFVKIDAETRINVKLSGVSSLVVNAKGPSITLRDEQALINSLNQIEDNDYLVLAGSVPSSMGELAYERMMNSIDKNVKLVVDTTGNALKSILKFNPFLIKPNIFEIEEILKRRLVSNQDIYQGAVELQQLGAKNVLVSLGRRGMMLVDENSNQYMEPIIDGEVKNTNGCGDSTVAGFIAGYIKKQDYRNALHIASICANATAFSNSLATKSEIDALLKL